jgi:hypothetical protein
VRERVRKRVRESGEERECERSRAIAIARKF